MNVLMEWTALVCRELGVDPAKIDRDEVLDLTKEVAHGVARPGRAADGVSAGACPGGGHGTAGRRGTADHAGA